jgi:hypothetical protein
MGRGGATLADARCAKIDNRLRNTVGIVQHVFRRDADRYDALTRHPSIARLVTLGVVTHIMRNTVDLERHLRRCTIKIQPIGSDAMLFAKSDTLRRLFEPLPEQHLG